MQPIRWGILGPGQIARAFAQDFQYVSDAELVAVASRSLERAQAFASDFGIPQAFNSYQSLLASGQVDVVYIATPHPQHAALVQMAIEHQVAVLCEKPFTLNAHQAEALFALAEARKVFVMEALWSRFNPAIDTVLDRLQHGVIGQPRMLRADFGFAVDNNPASRLLNPALGGGALLDIGIYPLFLALEVLGEPDEIVTQVVKGATGVDVMEQIQLRYNDGRLASLQASFVSIMPDEAVISGEQGYIRLPPRWFMPTEWQLGLPGQPLQTFAEQFDGVGWRFEAEEVNSCLRRGAMKSARWDWGKTLRLQRVMDSIRQQWGLRYPAES